MSWEMVKLSNIAEIIAGQSPESKFYNSIGDGIPFYQGKADFGLDYPTTRYWCSKPTKIAKSKDILVSVRAPVGPTNICEHEACIGRGLVSVRSTEKVYYKFLYYYFKTIEEKLSSLGNGSTFSAVTTNVIKDLQIPLPPLDTQMRIAEILDAADALRRKDKELLKKYDELAQAIFIDMFGDPVKNEKGWEVKKLGDVCKVQGGFSFKSTDLSGEGIKLMKIGNVHFESIDWSEVEYLPPEYIYKYKEYSLNEDDICIALTRPIIKSIDSVKVVRVSKDDLPCLLNQRVGRFTIDDKLLNRTYLLFFIYTQYFKNIVQKLSSTSLQPNIGTGQIENIAIPLPPVLNQSLFEENILCIMKLKSQSSKLQSSELFNSLLHKAFKGELVV